MIRRSLLGLLPALFGLLVAAPGTALASCVPPAFQTFAGEANTVVLEGGIVAVEPTRVIVDATKWWGAEPRERLAIQRPVADPTVITSVDWKPQAGETWLIIARREGDLFVTGTCEQLSADPATLNEVQSSLGAPVVPQTAAEPSGRPSMPIIPVAIGGLVVLAAAGFLVWQRRARLAA